MDLALELENLVDFLKKIFPKIGVQSVEIKEEVVPKLHHIMVDHYMEDSDQKMGR